MYTSFFSFTPLNRVLYKLSWLTFTPLLNRLVYNVRIFFIIYCWTELCISLPKACSEFWAGWSSHDCFTKIITSCRALIDMVKNRVMPSLLEYRIKRLNLIYVKNCLRLSDAELNYIHTINNQLFDIFIFCCNIYIQSTLFLSQITIFDAAILFDVTSSYYSGLKYQFCD